MNLSSFQKNLKEVLLSLIATKLVVKAKTFVRAPSALKILRLDLPLLEACIFIVKFSINSVLDFLKASYTSCHNNTTKGHFSQRFENAHSTKSFSLFLNCLK